MYADPAHDRATVISYIERTAAKIENPSVRDVFAKSASSIVSSRFEAQPVTVKIETVEKVATERQLTSIDFLKVDVEGAELDVLTGIGAAWPLVANIIVELEDRDGRLAAATSLLQAQDFSLRTWQMPDYHGRPFHLVAAHRA
jgi:methyltransferase FkbM-like protein